jgi:uncharacterized membrane protein
MAVLGLLLMLGCAAVATDAVIQNTQIMHAVLFNQHITGFTLGAVFVTGCVIGLVFALGLAMLLGGFSRGVRTRRERRALRRESAEAEALRERNASLEQQVAANDTAAYPAEPTTTTTTADTVDTSGRHRV